MRKFLILGVILILLITGFIFGLVFLSENVFFLSQASNLNFGSWGDYTFLLLGKPGPGYIGSENTDSLIVAYYHYRKNKLFLIAVPRDLIVKDENGNLEKINALYEKKKINLLFSKVSAFTGLRVKNYFAVDLELVKKIVDKLGGIEIYLEQPVVDAVSLYTLPAGKYKLNGDLIELVLRSRYNSEGDFFRIKNQIKFLTALKNKLLTLNDDELLNLLKFLEANRYYWDSNFNKNNLFFLVLKAKDIKNLEIIPIVIDIKSGLLKSGYFELYGKPGIYGIYPSLGIDNFDLVQIYIRSKIKEYLL
jgi:LCP family protein required for cell wall assembly